MCVDYKDLNKHCPKDPFPLPRIDQVVDSTAGCTLLSFLDCYSGYHQIAPEEVGSREDIIHHALRGVLLQHYDVRPQERRRHLPEGHPEMPPGADRPI